MKMENFICDIFFDHRLSEIECGRKVTQVSVFMTSDGDGYEYIGENTGMIRVKNIEDIFDQFGPAIDIEIDLKWGNDFRHLLKYIDPKVEDWTFKQLKEIKAGNINFVPSI